MDKNKLAEDWIDEKGYYNSALRINTQHRVDLYLTDVLAEYHEYLASNGLLSSVVNCDHPRAEDPKDKMYKDALNKWNKLKNQ